MTSLLLFVCPWDWLVQASRDSPYRNAKVTDPKDSNSGLNACTATAFFSMVQLPKPLQCSLFTLRIQTGYHLWNYYKAIYHFVLKEKKDDFLICFSLLEMPQVVPARGLTWAVLLTALCVCAICEDPGCSFRFKTSMYFENHIIQKEQQLDISWLTGLEDSETFA